MEMRQDLNTLSDQREDSGPDTHRRNTDEWKKGGRLLSGLVGSNVLLFGGALATCVFTEDVDIFEFDFLIYLSVMMVICILWMFIQMYFTWKNKHAILYKDCQAGPIWMRDENEHCGCSSHCKKDTTMYIYLYPFNIEYNLFAAAMIYIMWKNVGRQIDENASHHHGIGPGFRQHIPLLGLACGLTIFTIGLVMFVMYEIGRDNKDRQWLSLTTFCIFHIVSLVLMCLANIVGIIIFRLDKRNMDKEKNPSRALDTGLLLGATLGQYAISYYSIIAMVSTQPFSSLGGLMLSYSVLMILQHSSQNAFIIEGLHRLPPNLLLSPTSSNIPCPPDEHETIKQVSAPEADRRQSLTGPKTSSRRLSRRGTLSAQIKSHLKKRKTMKDVYLFLFLSNLIFWIMPAFGARIRFDNGLEVKFYGFTLWAIITNICLPFGIFYRMHAAATLLELYSMS